MYACTDFPDNVTELDHAVDDWQAVYHFIRPYGAVGGLTPAEDLLRRSALTIPESSQKP